MCRRFAQRLGVVVAAVDYRLAPEHPFALPLDDCRAAPEWLVDRPDVDRERIAIGGASAGGGLAVALALDVRDRNSLTPVLQLLAYPMLGDRTASTTNLDRPGHRLWNTRANRFGWRSYPGPRTGVAAEVLPLAAPARCADLAGLAPAWIGVGDLDLLHEEDLDHARRLQDAGVPCSVTVVPGAFHVFDAAHSKAAVSEKFVEAQISALGPAFRVGA